MKTIQSFVVSLLLLFSYANAQWQQIGDPLIGEVDAFAFRGSKIFAGGTGGVFVSIDGGINWSSINNGMSNTTVVALAIVGDSIYAGTNGKGVFLSPDNGTNWIPVNSGLTSTNIFALSSIGNNLYAGTDGGVFFSSDAGNSWTKTKSFSDPALMSSMTVCGANIFIGTRGGSVYRSSNNGVSWQLLNTNTGLTTTYIWSLSANGTNLYAGTGKGGVFKSTNNGTTWSNIGLVGKDIDVLTAYGDTIIAAVNQDGVYLSTDSGASWKIINGRGFTDEQYMTIAFSGNTLFVGAYYSGFFSNDLGLNWHAFSIGRPQTCVTSIIANRRSLCVGTINGGVYSSTNDGTDWKVSRFGETGYVSNLVSNDTVIFASIVSGIFRSKDNGFNWTIVDSGLVNNSPLCMVIADPYLYTGTYSGGVFRSTDNGTSWNLPSTDLTNTSINALTVSGANLFAGTISNGGGVFLSTNSGTSWTAVNTGLTYPMVQSLAVLGSNLFAGTDYGGVFRSTDNGTSWIAVNTGLTNTSIYALAVSGTNLFAGTAGGVFLSTNNGISWTEVNTGLTNTDVRALATSPNGAGGTNLFAGTYGSGIFKRLLSEMVASVERLSADLPIHFNLGQNYPNPFNPVTTISYDLPKKEHTTLIIYDILGRQLETLINEMQQQGKYKVTFNGSNLSSGVYFYRLKAGSFAETKQFVLLK